MNRFFIDPSKIDTSVISGTDANHIKNVLRLKPGDKILLFDGKGLEYEAQITTLGPKRVEVSIIRSFLSTTESPVQITVAQAFLKDKKMDTLIRQLTELGITKWVPFISERSVPRPDKKRLTTRAERWKKIAKESLKQCRRGRLMEIGAVVSFEEMLDMGRDCDLKVLFWEKEAEPVRFQFLQSEGRKYNHIFAVLGPEGGFSSTEVETARNSGCVTATLGPRILRAETATVAACTLLQFFFGDMEKSLDNGSKIQ